MSKKIYIGSTEIAGGDGRSAYQIWLDEGNVGTEEQFMASLNGVGIASVTQTTTSSVDGGTNVWTVTKTDGTSSTFQVKNGNQGNSGYSGAAGELEVVNNLTSTDATAALSANMGRVLDEEISQLGLEVVGGDVSHSEQTETITSSSAWMNNDGAIGYTSSSVLKRVAPITIRPGSTIRLITALSWSTANPAHLCDDNGNVISSLTRTGSSIDYTGVVPTGATKIYINTTGEFSLTETVTGDIAELSTQIAAKQDVLTFDSVPTEDSTNPVTSGGIYDEFVKVGNNTARIPVTNITPLPLNDADFEVGNIDGRTGANVYGTSIRTINSIDVYPGSIISITTTNSYRVAVAAYEQNGAFIAKREWLNNGDKYNVPMYCSKVRFVIALPSGESGTATFVDSGFVAIPNINYQITRAEASGELYYKQIFAPSPQLPANASDGSDFNAETLTPSELYEAFDALISQCPTPRTTAETKTPYLSKYASPGRDYTNTYDINAYILTRRNRYAWLAVPELYAWAAGSTVRYTYSASPRVGDSIMDSNATTFAKVASYNAATGEIIGTNSGTYTRKPSSDIAAVIGYSQEEQKNSLVNLSLFNPDGTFIGTGTPTDATTLSYDGKSYVRDISRDFHTQHKATIVLWGNEHGPQSDPAEPSIVLYRLAKDLSSGCRNNEFLQFLKDYCKVVIVPCLNPYGLANHTRNNGNGVNINRNYNCPGWASQSDNDKGAYAGSEPETHFIMDLVKTLDADLAVDVHCLGYVTQNNEGQCHHSGFIPNPSYNNEMVKDIMYGYGLNYSNYGDATPSTAANGPSWLYNEGIAGGLIEMNAGFYAADGGDGNQHTAQIMEADYTLLLNAIRMWWYGFDPTFSLASFKIC